MYHVRLNNYRKDLGPDENRYNFIFFGCLLFFGPLFFAQYYTNWTVNNANSIFLLVINRFCKFVNFLYFLQIVVPDQFCL